MNRIKLVILSVVLIISFLVLKKFKNDYYSTRIINMHSYVINKYSRDKIDFGDKNDKSYKCKILYEALTGFYKWEQLPLTDHFKNKFKNRKNILKEIEKVISLDVTHEPFSTDNEVIVIGDLECNTVSKYLFGNRAVEAKFRCIMINDKLDDIEILDKKYVDCMTGDVIKTL